MNWILIAVVSGSILTSGHDTEEHCLGRKEILAKDKIVAKCVEKPANFSITTSGTICSTTGCWSR